MKAAELRQSILQAAVQGKLVPQNPDDKPASELLKCIDQEKIQLIKEGKIKKEKPLPLIAKDEIPFDLPEGWVWCRVGNIAHQVTSGSREWAKYYSTSGAKFIRMGNLSRSHYRLKMENVQYVSPPNNVEEGKRTSLQENDILVSITGDVGLLGLVPSDFGEAYINQHVALVRCSPIMSPIFVVNVFLSPLCVNQFNAPQRGIKNSFRLTDLLYMLVPVPPQAEQERIVAKLYELMTLCDKLEAEEKELDALESHFTEHLPKSILQAAVQGKLVPQDYRDKPASELLRRIQQQKAQLVKEGKLKKGKPLPPISQYEAPYDLPEGWEWCRLGELVDLLSGRDLEPSAYNDLRMGIPYITGASNLTETDISITRWTQQPLVVSITGDILLSCKGTIGKIVFNTIGDCHIARQIMAIRPLFTQVLPEYIFIILIASIDDLIIRAKSIIPGISRSDVMYLAFPLPPLAEQQRIVAKVDELMALCNELKSAYTTPVKFSKSDNIIQFPAVEPVEETLLVARGDVESLSLDALKAIDNLFAEDTE